MIQESKLSCFGHAIQKTTHTYDSQAKQSACTAHPAFHSLISLLYLYVSIIRSISWEKPIPPFRTSYIYSYIHYLGKKRKKERKKTDQLINYFVVDTKKDKSSGNVTSSRVGREGCSEIEAWHSTILARSHRSGDKLVVIHRSRVSKYVRVE